MCQNDITPKTPAKQRDDLLRRALATPPISNETIISRSLKKQVKARMAEEAERKA